MFDKLNVAAAPVVAAVDGYTPADLTADLDASVILLWMAAGIGGGIGIYLLSIGINKGIGWFGKLAKRNG